MEGEGRRMPVRGGCWNNLLDPELQQRHQILLAVAFCNADDHKYNLNCVGSCSQYWKIRDRMDLVTRVYGTVKVEEEC